MNLDHINKKVDEYLSRPIEDIIEHIEMFGYTVVSKDYDDSMDGIDGDIQVKEKNYFTCGSCMDANGYDSSDNDTNETHSYKIAEAA